MKSPFVSELYSKTLFCDVALGVEVRRVVTYLTAHDTRWYNEMIIIHMVN